VECFTKRMARLVDVLPKPIRPLASTTAKGGCCYSEIKIAMRIGAHPFVASLPGKFRAAANEKSTMTTRLKTHETGADRLVRPNRLQCRPKTVSATHHSPVFGSVPAAPTALILHRNFCNRRYRSFFIDAESMIFSTSASHAIFLRSPNNFAPLRKGEHQKETQSILTNTYFKSLYILIILIQNSIIRTAPEPLFEREHINDRAGLQTPT